MICKGDRIIVGDYAILVTNDHETDEKSFLICNIYLVCYGKYRNHHEKLCTITVGVHDYEVLRRNRNIDMLNALMTKSSA